MQNLNKYKINLYINFENSDVYNIKPKIVSKLNYLYKHKNRIFRNFLIVYSVTLIFSQFSTIVYKNEVEYNTNFNIIYFLIFDNSITFF